MPGLLRRLLCLLPVLIPATSLYAQLVANFTANSVSGCAPMVVSFTSTGTGSPTSYSWNFGNSLTSTAANPTTSYTSPGTYTVSLTVSNGTSSNTVTKTGYITVKQVPVPTITSTGSSICPGSAASFSSSVVWNATGTGTYFWDFGDGGNATSANPSHTYNNPGTYTVTLTATNSVGCPGFDTVANAITVFTPPVANFTASDTAICSAGGSTVFTSTTSGTGPFNLTWNFGDGGSATSSPVTHNYSTLGTYTVRLFATDAHGCVDSEVKSSFIRVRSVTASANIPATGCAGIPLLFHSTSSTGAYIYWKFGDGNTDTGVAPQHSYASSGTYPVTMYASIGGCTDSVVQSVTINPRPTPSFSFPPFPCPSPITVSFNNTSTGATNYSWVFGDGGTSTAVSPSHTYALDDTFTVVLTAVNSFGCQSSALHDIIIFPAAFKVKADSKEGCIPFTVNLRDSITSWDDLGHPVPYPGTIVSRTWNFGDGSGTSSAATPSHTYTTTGTFVVTVTSTTSNGCTFIDTLHIHTGTHVIPAFGAMPRTVCVNESVFFTDSTIGGPVTAWSWDFGDGGYSSFQNPVYHYNIPDTYYVKLVTSVNGCKDSITKLNYIVVNYPKAFINYTVNCASPLLVQFDDSLMGATSHIWYFGDGTTSTAFDPSHQYASAGTYIVALVAYNATTGCKDSMLYSLNLNPIQVNFVANDTAICKGDTIKLTAIVTGLGSVSAYSWWRGSGTATPTYVYNPLNPDSSIKYYSFPNPGRYHIGLQVKNQHGCPVTATTKNNYITVGGTNVSFSAVPPIGCAPANITFTDNSIYTAGVGPITRKWEFGDGTRATLTTQSTTHGYPSTGSYGISLVVTDNIGCVDSLGIPNFLLVSHPNAGFTTINPNACVGAPITFFNTSSGNGLTYAWNFGDGGTATSASPAHIYTATGTYTVRLIVTDNVGCKDTMTKSAYVNVFAKPNASFTMDDSIKVCPPLIVNFTNTSVGAVSYNWNFGNGGVSTLTNPSNTYISPAVNVVRLVATNAAGCHDTALATVRVLGYAGVLSYSPLTGCAPLTVNFKANNVTGVPGFIYDFGDGTTAASTSTTISHTYTTAGPHVPKITLTDNLGCSVTSPGIDTIKVDGVIAGFTFSPFPACNKGTITFIDTSKGAYSALATRSWTFHDGTTSTASSPTKTYTGPGTYGVTLISTTTSGCKDTFRSSVIFYSLPIIDAGADTIVCLTDAATLKPSGGVSYTWSPGATLSCTNCTNPLATPTVQTKYTVIGTDQHGCTNTDTVTVRIRTKTTATVSPGTEICSGKEVVLTAEGGSTYLWSPPTGLSSTTVSNPTASPMTTQHYMVITQLASCIPDTDYVDIVVHPTPEVEAGANQTIIAGNIAQLQAVGSGFITHWEWSPSESLSCANCSAPEATPKRTTLYTVVASTEFNCEATDTVRVFVVCDNNQVYLPNTFTPDGNGVNDVFYPRGRGLSIISTFRVYDRWGEVVFERNNIKVDDETMGWDGRKGGRLLSPDVYVYVIEGICDTGEPIKWQGDVMLLR